MFGKSTPILSAVIISLAAAPAAFAYGRALPGGPEWYADDNGLWRSLRENWRNLQRVSASLNDKHGPSHKHRHSAHYRERLSAAPLRAGRHTP